MSAYKKGKEHGGRAQNCESFPQTEPEKIFHIQKPLKGIGAFITSPNNKDRRITNISEKGLQTCYPWVFQGAFILQALAVVCQETDSVAVLVLGIPIPPSFSY